MLNEVDMERVKLQEERARMEIAKTLQSSTRPDSVLSRAEIDAAVKYAEVSEIFCCLLFHRSLCLGIYNNNNEQHSNSRCCYFGRFL